MIESDGRVASFSKAKEEPIENEKQRALAMENEKKRRAGTHVYHPDHGVIEIGEAEAILMQFPSAKRRAEEKARFQGDPETGVVAKWDGGRVVVDDETPAPSAPAAPTKPAA